MTTKQNLLPSSKSNEYAILSLMMKHSDNRMLLTDITEEYFYDKKCADTFKAIRKLEQSNSRISVQSIHDKLIDMGVVDITIEMLDIVRTHVCHSDKIQDYKDTLEHKLLERKLAMTGEAIKEIAFKDTTLDEKISESISALTSLNYSVGEATMTHAEAKKKLLAEVIANMGREDSQLTWGIDSLDELLGGVPPDLIAIGAMEGLGKTAYAVHMLMINAMAGHNTLFFSSEMNSTMVMLREIQKDLGISVTKMRSGKISKEELKKIEEYKTCDNLWINDVSNLDVDKLVSIATLHHKKHGLKLIVVDYLQLLSTTKFKDQEIQQISYISKQLKGLSHKLNIPVVALVQFNKEAAKSNKPTKALIYGSGQISKDSGAVILIHREDYFDKTIANNRYDPKNGLVEFIVDKNRFGRIGSAYAKWIPEETSYKNLPANFNPNSVLNKPSPKRVDDDDDNDVHFGAYGTPPPKPKAASKKRF